MVRGGVTRYCATYLSSFDRVGKVGSSNNRGRFLVGPPPVFLHAFLIGHVAGSGRAAGADAAD